MKYEKKYLLSVVVPTKNRYKYLKHLIGYVASTFPSKNIELVIQDNTVNNVEILEFIHKYENYENIRYFHEPTPLSMGENSDLAIKHSTGKFVSFIGDDDCFLPCILNIIEYVITHKAEAIVTPRLTYVWPDAEKYITYLSTDLQFKDYDCSKRIVENDEIIKVLKIGGQSMCNMPRVYHGIVLRETLDRLWNKYGTYFPGPSPDMANAIALALMEVKTLFINYPVIIAGTGFARIKGNEKGDRQTVEDTHFLKNDVLSHWNDRIPKLWTTPTIYAQTVYHGVNSVQKDLLKFFNWNAFFVSLGAEFFKDFWKLARTEHCFHLIPQIIKRKIKIQIFRSFKTPINKIRGYKSYNIDTSSVEQYARTIENNIGVFELNNE